MPGRKTFVVESLFKSAPTDSTFKMKRVKCIFCSTIISKNGTSMVNHIRKSNINSEELSEDK